MEVGYLPDMFGHIAQMPQILRLAGFEHAVVWRGVPTVVDRSAFVWEAPDGSSVRAEYLPTGYGNGASIPDDAKALVRRIADHEKEIGDFLIDGMLFMNGTDHQEPQPWLGRVVAEANELQDDYVLEVTTLADYLAGAPTAGPAHVEGRAALGGEGQRPHGRGVEPGRREAGRGARRAGPGAARRAAERPVPAGGAVAAAPAGPGVARDGAQRRPRLLVCVLGGRGRRRRAGPLRRGLPDRRRPGRPGARGADAVAGRGRPHRRQHLGARPAAGWSEFVVAGEEVPAGTQALPEEPGAFGIPRGLGPLTLDANTVRTILGMLPNGSQIDTHTWIQDVRVEEDDSGIDITIAFGSEERFDVPIASIKQDLYTRLGARPDAIVRIRIDQPPVRRVLVRVADVPGFGHTALEPAAPTHPVTVEDAAPRGPWS